MKQHDNDDDGANNQQKHDKPTRSYGAKLAPNYWRNRFNKLYGENQKNQWHKSEHKSDKNLFGDCPT